MEFDFLNQFHFLRPEWFIALVPLMLLVFLIRKTTAKQSGWQSVISIHGDWKKRNGRKTSNVDACFCVDYKCDSTRWPNVGAPATAGLPVENGTRYSHRYVAFNARYRYDARQANSR